MAKKYAIPKKIAGFKVPKPIRKSSVLRSLLASDVGRNIMANALTAGAGAAAAVLLEERGEIAKASKKGARKGAGAIAIATEAIERGADAAMDVLKDSAHSVLPKKMGKKGKRSLDRDEDRPFGTILTH